MLVNTRDEDASIQVVLAEPKKKSPDVCKPVAPDPGRYMRKPSSNTHASVEKQANSSAMNTATLLPETLALPASGASIEPILVCAGTGVAASSNNESEQVCDDVATISSKPFPSVTSASSKLMRQRNNSHPAMPTLIRSDSELEGIIQELRDHIFKQNQADKQPEAAETSDVEAVHHRRHLKNPLEKVKQAGKSERSRASAHPRPSSSLSKRLQPSSALSTHKTESSLPILITGAIPTTTNQHSQSIAGSVSVQINKPDSESTAELNDGSEHKLLRNRDEDHENCRLVEGATLNPRPARKPPVPTFSTSMRQLAATPATTTSESEQSRPRRERMRAHNYALAVECGSDSDNSTDTDSGSPVGPWVVVDGFGSVSNKQDTSSPTTSVSALSNLSFYDEEVANRSPRSRLLWLSDFGDDEVRGSCSTSTLLRLKWERESATDCLPNPLVRVASCPNTRKTKKTRPASHKLKRCSSANPSKRVSTSKSVRGNEGCIGKPEAEPNN